MNKPIKSSLFWTPRILCLLFAAFISIFAADAFGEGQGFWNTTLLLLLHLIPTAAILVILALSWRREWVGGILFTALGVLYLILFWGRFPWSVYVTISGPLFVVGGLFLINWLSRATLRATT
jgi:hypothetical protein